MIDDNIHQLPITIERHSETEMILRPAADQLTALRGIVTALRAVAAQSLGDDMAEHLDAFQSGALRAVEALIDDISNRVNHAINLEAELEAAKLEAGRTDADRAVIAKLRGEDHDGPDHDPPGAA